MYKLIEYSDNYSKTWGTLRQYYRDDPNDNIVNSESFKFKLNIARKTPDAGNTKSAKIAVPLKYLSNFWRTLEMSLVNCEINFILTGSRNCVVSSATGKTKFAITDTKRYVPIVTLSTQDSEKLLGQLKSGFKRTINWNKYQSKVSTERQNQYLDFLIDPIFNQYLHLLIDFLSFQGVNRLFVLLFENEGNRKVQTEYYLPKVELKDYNVITDGKNFFWSAS